MKTRILLLFAGLMVAGTRSEAQSYSIRGQVTDTFNKNNLPHASVTLLRAEDSVLETFTRTNASGNFELQPKKAGNYLLMVTFPKFVDFVDVVKVTDKDVSTGLIPMISKTNLLKEFVVKQQVAAIRIKGDTTEYMADSFKVREGATVEELLKKLPGIQVDKNGQVSAQGEKVQKILVDGEEFFTDDPAVVTKGLQAKTVETVQVFDKKSDQAEFTGIDDGEKIKTLNLKLKDNAKKGYFGKLNLGGGTGQYFENQGMINAFKGKRKLSAFGIVSNTDKVGLNWQDRDKFGGGSNMEMSEDGDVSYYMSSGGNDDFASWDGSYNGQGLPKVWTGGLHYSDKWGDKDKYHFNGNYRYAKQNLETEGNTLTEYTLPGSRYLTNEKRDQFSTGQRHGADALYEWQIDSSSSIKLTANGGYRETQATNRYLTSAINNEDDTLNTGIRSLTSDANTKNMDATLLYRKKFAKKGRSFSANLSENFKESQSDGFLKSITRYFTSAKDSVLDQHKVNNSQNLTVKSKLTYTEPLSKVAFLELNYALMINNSSAEKNSFDRQQSGEYTDSQNQMFSSNYRYDIMQNTGGASMRFVYKKYNFSFGGDVSNTQFNQQNLATDTIYHRSVDRTYNNFFPKANFTYKPNKQASLRFNYYGSTKQPTIDQIQPLRDNTNPLNTPVGNPDLKQEFRNNFSLGYNNYKVLTNRYLWSHMSFTTVDNAISRADVINTDGTRTYQYLNVDGNYNVWGYGGYGMKIKQLDLQVGINGNIGLNHNNSFVNGEKNVSNNNSYGLGMDFNYDLEDKKDKEKTKLSVSFNPTIAYNDNKSSISTYTTSYWSSENDLRLTYQLPYKIEISTSANWYIREKTEVFPTNNNVFRWNAYVAKKLLKGDQMELRASVFDILNQNVGFSRYANSNMVNQDSYNTIRRYGLFSVIWNFTHTPAGGAKQENSTIIIK